MFAERKFRFSFAIYVLFVKRQNKSLEAAKMFSFNRENKFRVSNLYIIVYFTKKNLSAYLTCKIRKSFFHFLLSAKLNSAKFKEIDPVFL